MKNYIFDKTINKPKRFGASEKTLGLEPQKSPRSAPDLTIPRIAKMVGEYLRNTPREYSTEIGSQNRAPAIEASNSNQVFKWRIYQIRIVTRNG